MLTAALHPGLMNASWLHDAHLREELWYLMKTVITEKVSLPLTSHKTRSATALRSRDLQENESIIHRYLLKITNLVDVCNALICFRSVWLCAKACTLALAIACVCARARSER